MSITVELISENKLSGMREPWNALLSESASDNIFLTWEWLWTWWEVFKQGKELCLVAVNEENRLIGLAPFYHEMGSGRALKFCSAEDLYPDYLDVIAARGKEKEVGAALNKFLTQSNRWDRLHFDNLPEGSILQNALTEGSGWKTILSKTDECPYVLIEGTFSDYLRNRFDGERRRKHENTIRRAKKELQFVAPHGDADTEAALHTLFKLHDERARQKGIESSFTRKLQKEFHLRFAPVASKNEWLELHLLCLGGQPIAGLYGFRYRRKIYFYQQGSDPQHEKRSPGNIMFFLLLEKAHEDKLEEYDFLKGGEAYKARWCSHQRNEFRIMAYKPGLKGFCAYTYEKVKTSMRAAIAERRRKTPA